MTQELYRIDGNGQMVLRVSSETRTWLPRPNLDRTWLRETITAALQRWLVGRRS